MNAGPKDHGSKSGGPKSDVAGLVAMAKALESRLSHRVRDLTLSLHKQGIVLTGLANTYYDKQMAQHLAMQISGRCVVENRIDVSPHSVRRNQQNLETNGGVP
jgi:hypothetical protein